MRSDLLLPEFEAIAARSAEVRIRLGKVAPPPGRPLAANEQFRIADGRAYLSWDGVGRFRVRGGREIVVAPAPGVEERILRMPLLGMVFAQLLHQRGLLVLHASAVAVEGAAVAFLGSKGWGKSTIAAALHARGHDVVTDDVLALDLATDGSPLVLPGFPLLKLWPDALASSLGEAPEDLPRVHPQLEKRAWRITDGVPRRPRPLCCIYLLQDGPVLEIEPVAPRAAVIELIRHSYSARLGTVGLLGERAASHLGQCRCLIDQTSFRVLRRPRSLAALPEMAGRVEADLSTQPWNGASGRRPAGAQVVPVIGATAATAPAVVRGYHGAVGSVREQSGSGIE